MSEDIRTIENNTSVPFFLRIAAILILVTGTLGFLFYLTSLGFQLTGSNFLFDQEYKGFSGLSFTLILIIQVLLNAGLILSGSLILKLKLAGLYVFITSYLIFSTLSYLIFDDSGWTLPIIGMVISLIIFVHYRKLK